ncbi:hypothetical protein RRG08_049446 [Elysia crispata]|uniref:Uncharacterized protein n=1 Tax=Elysia crispata TaxID=231223 RepID=A0AAE1DLS3_9GAST|nr:hypothetical protein RRG08_049446 [Elysia crispata]
MESEAEKRVGKGFNVEEGEVVGVGGKEALKRIGRKEVVLERGDIKVFHVYSIFYSVFIHHNMSQLGAISESFSSLARLHTAEPFCEISSHPDNTQKTLGEIREPSVGSYLTDPHITRHL